MKIKTYSRIFDEILYPRVKDRVDSFCLEYFDNFFRDKDYGEDVKEIRLHISLVDGIIPPHVCRPRYYECYTMPKSPICLSAIPETFVKMFDMDSTISPEVFKELLKASDEETDAIIARHFYKSLDNLDELPKRLKHFDKERFKKDVESLFKSHGWL